MYLLNYSLGGCWWPWWDIGTRLEVPLARLELSVVLLWATVFFWSQFPCQCRSWNHVTEKLRVALPGKQKHSCSNPRTLLLCRRAARKFFCLIPVILRCRSVFKLGKKILILGFYFHRAEHDTTWNIWACNFVKVISPSFFSHVKRFSKWNLWLNRVKELTVAEFQLSGFISCIARC